MIVLRPEQAKLKNDAYIAYQQGSRNVLAVLPTGGGKSVVSSDITLDQERMGSRQCVIAHRTELVSQMSIHVARRGIRHRIIGSKSTIAQIVTEHRQEFGKSFISPDANCAVASVDTLIARRETLTAWAQQINFWTIDEAHHVLGENKWGTAVAMFPNALGLGLTATPKRADGKGLGAHHDGVFNSMVLGPTMRELIDLGSLCDYEIAVPESDFEIDDSQIAASGDWSTKRMREASKRSHIVGDVVNEYQRRSLGKRAICFATDVETAGEMATNFQAAGITAAAVSAKTPTSTRNEFIRRFRDGSIHVLVNVDLFGEGFDVPAVETVIMARPTASLAVYLQQFGRALRVMEGKPYGLVIDHVSNWKRHGLPDKPHPWTLDRREKRARKEPDPDDIPLTTCKSCSRPYERALIACPYCGAEPEVTPANRSLQKVDGDLVLLDRDALAELRANIELESPASVAERVGAAAGALAGKGQANRQIERIQAQKRLIATVEQWAGCQRHSGRDDREIHKRFYLATGVSALEALAMPRAEMDKYSATVEGWIEKWVTSNQ